MRSILQIWDTQSSQIALSVDGLERRFSKARVLELLALTFLQAIRKRYVEQPNASWLNDLSLQCNSACQEVIREASKVSPVDGPTSRFRGNQSSRPRNHRSDAMTTGIRRISGFMTLPLTAMTASMVYWPAGSRPPRSIRNVASSPSDATSASTTRSLSSITT